MQHNCLLEMTEDNSLQTCKKLFELSDELKKKSALEEHGHKVCGLIVTRKELKKQLSHLSVYIKNNIALRSLAEDGQLHIVDSLSIVLELDNNESQFFHYLTIKRVSRKVNIAKRYTLSLYKIFILDSKEKSLSTYLRS